MILKMTDIKYELKRSKRKTISVEISREATIIVRAPLKMSIRDIEAFLNSKREWIISHLGKVEQKLLDIPPKLTSSELFELKKRAKKELPIRVDFYANQMGVEYGRIALRTQKTRFGSCSTKKNLNFNLAILLMPQEITDYVIVHELAHLKEMNHSDKFWHIVESIIPDYKQKRAWLKENGIKYIQKI